MDLTSQSCVCLSRQKLMSEPDTLREPRFKLANPLIVTYVSGNSRGEGRIEDVSPKGFFIHTPMLPQDGSHVTAIITTTSGQLLSVEGTVRWNTIAIDGPTFRSGFGVRVTRCGAEYTGFVQGVIAAASALEEKPDAG